MNLTWAKTMQRTRSNSQKRLPPVPTDTFKVMPLSIWTTLWSRRWLHSIRRGYRAMPALISGSANDN